MRDQEKGMAVGIDLGTTYSSIAAVVDAGVQVADTREGNKTLPSVISFSADGSYVVGERAENMAIIRPNHTVKEVKRLMGKDVAAFTHPDTGRDYSPTELSSFILAELKACAEDYFGKDISLAVISVPAHFGDAQRQDTARAGEMAGFKVLAIKNEPTMVILAYQFVHPDMPDGVYGVLDVGGGTMDMTIAEVSEKQITIKVTDGDRRLGGTDFTRELYNLVLERCQEELGVAFDPNVPEDAACLQDVWERAERAKRELSRLSETVINLMAKGKQLTVEVSRSEFEALSQEHIEKIRTKTSSAIKQALGQEQNLDGIILAGGATRMPCIEHLVNDLTGGNVQIHKDISTDLAVAMGCAITAYELSGNALLFLPSRNVKDVTSFDISIAAVKAAQADPGKMVLRCIIPKGTPLPVTKSERFGLLSLPSDTAQLPELIICEGEEGEPYREEMKVQAFALEGLPPSDNPKEERIEVTISVDESGLITVEALDLKTGQKLHHQVDRKAIAKGGTP